MLWPKNDSGWTSPASPAARIVQLEHITQRFGTRERQFVAIQGWSLSVDEREFVALLVPSGCGKSTLLRIISGLTTPNEGRVRPDMMRSNVLLPHPDGPSSATNSKVS